ncbi:hypothetical protein C8F04DRAFT_45032 [Mycena alexandri]|uniref:Major facilitator superfamily (MFS) profile domain-containing protein n=1 Tax=Mycena alexandri TaxID=1745969 RepID=A0AAD6SN14_9AGAR|nr:hypothetical protein C8F04DRAFT_45032 [Mycena alexandri]
MYVHRTVAALARHLADHQTDTRFGSTQYQPIPEDDRGRTPFKSQLDDFSRYRNSYLLACSVALGSLFYGYDIGLIGGVLALDSFQHYFGLDEMTPGERAWLNGNIVAILQLGCL